MSTIHSFLLMGQSNMAGRGIKSEVAPIDNKNIVVFRNGRWTPFFVPVNFDDEHSGISLAETFADSYEKKYNVTVGLIPCAFGGTTIEMWKKGENLYENAVFQAKLAQNSSVIKGILWHQGESDCQKERLFLYREKLSKMIGDFRQDTKLFDVPIIIGGLGDFLPRCHPDYNNYDYINKVIKEVARDNMPAAFVRANGLTSNDDMLHFNSTSLRKFGVRYFNAFETIKEEEQNYDNRK